MSPAELLGIGLVLISILLFALEIKAPGFGVLGVGGVVSLLGGIVLLYGATWATLPVLIGIAIPVLLVLGFLSVLAHRARRRKVVTGNAGMIGLEGRTETDLAPEGRVIVRGELWDAWSPVRLERGQPIRVTGVRGLRLEVESVDARHVLSPPPASFLHPDDREVPQPAHERARGSS